MPHTYSVEMLTGHTTARIALAFIISLFYTNVRFMIHWEPTPQCSYYFYYIIEVHNITYYSM